MKYLIDLGTHYFEGLEDISKKVKANNKWTVYCYEPDPITYNKALELYSETRKKYKNLHFFQKAVSNTNRTDKFYCHDKIYIDNELREDRDPSECSTLIGIDNFKSPDGLHDVKRTLKETIDVNVIDVNSIISWICKNDKKAKIYIKCDTEGEEFVILPRIFKSEYINHVKFIAIEWHHRFWSKNESEYFEKLKLKEEIISTLKKLNIEYVRHH
jgi:FkbM family methyltransferase